MPDLPAELIRKGEEKGVNGEDGRKNNNIDAEALDDKVKDKEEEKDDEEDDHRILVVGKPDYTRCDNTVTTSKFTIWSYLPLAFWAQFRRTANMYFLIMSLLMCFGRYTDLFTSAVTPWTTLGPLILMMAASVAQEGVADMGRHRADKVTNQYPCTVLTTTRTTAATNNDDDNGDNDDDDAKKNEVLHDEGSMSTTTTKQQQQEVISEEKEKNNDNTVCVSFPKSSYG